MKVLVNFFLLLLAIGFLKSCFFGRSYDCDYCGTFVDSHRLKSFTVKKGDSEVRYCDKGEATYLDPGKKECWDLSVAPLDDDTGKSFSLSLRSDNVDAYQRAHLFPGLPSDCTFQRGGGWTCGDNKFSVVVGTFGRAKP
ncbi:hypothetical protein [Burkholderia gladioli]|uniref:hypothetical protein n=1 Tax=Burkholderia gladioli TaxID=28095 RepID=UPI0016417B8E|nr:hypothetical protein [Burkholderia gladioli]